MSALQRYHELEAKVDAFFARVHERYGDSMECRLGCSDCCCAGLTVTAVEASVIAAGLATLPAKARERISAHAARGDATRCAALDEHGRCEIYTWRPLVCRSQGVPIRFEDEHTHLPVVDACEKNEFRVVEADTILDQTTLSTVLAAVDTAHANEVGARAGERVDLASLLANDE